MSMNFKPDHALRSDDWCEHSQIPTPKTTAPKRRHVFIAVTFLFVLVLTAILNLILHMLKFTSLGLRL